METMARKSRRNRLTPIDNAILEQYARGESYGVIQFNLKQDYGVDLSQRALGEEMGKIKRKMRCQTQFQMGYLYKEREVKTHNVEAMHARRVHAAQKASYVCGRMKGYQEASSQVEAHLLGKDWARGLNAGLVMATLFWLVMFGIISQNFM